MAAFPSAHFMSTSCGFLWYRCLRCYQSLLLFIFFIFIRQQSIASGTQGAGLSSVVRLLVPLPFFFFHATSANKRRRLLSSRGWGAFFSPPRSPSLDVMEWTQTSVGGLSMSPRPLSRGGWVTEAVFVLALIMSTANMSAYTVKGGFNSDYCFFVFWKMGKALRRHQPTQMLSQERIESVCLSIWMFHNYDSLCGYRKTSVYLFICIAQFCVVHVSLGILLRESVPWWGALAKTSNLLSFQLPSEGFMSLCVVYSIL